jgi:hypothetical protein
VGGRSDPRRNPDQRRDRALDARITSA